MTPQDRGEFTAKIVGAYLTFYVAYLKIKSAGFSGDEQCA